MCDVIARVASDPSVPESNRRQFLRVLGATAAAGGFMAAGVGPASAGGPRKHGRGRRGRTRVVLLGTAGGPGILKGERFGISTAIAYENHIYLVDLGLGSLLRLRQSSLSGELGVASALANVQGIFFTHMHSDHLMDWPATYATGPINNVGRDLSGPCIKVFGPGDRGGLPQYRVPVEPPLVNPGRPMPGIKGMRDYLD